MIRMMTKYAMAWAFGWMPVLYAVQFNKVGGDIASSEDWGNSDSREGLYVDFIYGGVYYARADVGCRLVRLKNSAEVTLEIPSPDTVLTFNQESGDDSILLLPADGSAFTMKGGKWNAFGKSPANLHVGVNKNSSGGKNRRVTLCGGAKLYNLANVYGAGALGAQYDTDNVLRIKEQSSLETEIFYGWFCYNSGCMFTNNATVVEGGELLVKGVFATDGKLEQVAPGRVEGNVVEVKDGGKITQSVNAIAYVGHHAGEAGLSLSGEGSTAQLKTLRMGYEASSTNNRVCVRDGAVLAADSVYVGRHGAGNVLYVSNATLRVKGLVTMGYAVSSSNNTIHIAGAASALEIESPQLNDSEGLDFFPAASGRVGPGNEMLVTDGAVVTFQNVMGLFRVSHGNVLRVARGATFGQQARELPQVFSIGRWDSASSNNTVRVETQSTLVADYLRVTCVSNALVVSNATVCCAAADNDDVACYLGYKLSDRGPDLVTGNRLVLCGSTPSLRAPNGKVMLRYYSQLLFDVPSEGYPAEHVPLRAQTLEIRAGSLLDAVLTDHRTRGYTRTYTLAETTDGIVLGDGVLEGANARLSGAGRFSLSSDEKKLLLWAAGQGLTVWVR